jgi:hypothetical protein
MINCFKCEAEVNPLALFEGGLCVECYAQTREGRRNITGEQLAVMWGARVREGGKAQR